MNKNITAKPSDTFASGFVTSSGLKIHYKEKKHSDPTKPTLLFIPGISMPAWLWDDQLKYFSKNYSVSAMDLRSQGESEQTADGHFSESRAKDIKAVIEQRRLKPVVLVGWSLAVSDIICYLHQFGSEGILGVVLVDGFAGMGSSSAIYKFMVEYWSQFQKNREKNTKAFIKSMFRQPQSTVFIDKLTRSTLLTPTNTMMTIIYNFILSDCRPFLADFDKPTLFIAVKEVWLKMIKEMHRLTPNSELVIVEDAGHALFIDQPDRFKAILEDFLKTLK